MDNANTITDMAKTSNSVYEIVSDMATRQDSLEEKLATLEDKLQGLQEQLDLLPDVLSKCLLQHQDKVEQRRNFLHPDMANTAPPSLQTSAPLAPVPLGSPLMLPHSSEDPPNEHELNQIQTNYRHEADELPPAQIDYEHEQQPSQQQKHDEPEISESSPNNINTKSNSDELNSQDDNRH